MQLFKMYQMFLFGHVSFCYRSCWSLTKDLSEIPMSCSREVTVTLTQTHTTDRNWVEKQCESQRNKEKWTAVTERMKNETFELGVYGSLWFSLVLCFLSLSLWSIDLKRRAIPLDGKRSTLLTAVHLHAKNHHFTLLPPN